MGAVVGSVAGIAEGAYRRTPKSHTHLTDPEDNVRKVGK
jgi:hypothetical protein